MKKKILISSILILLMGAIIIKHNYNKSDVIEEEKTKVIKQENTLSMMLETEAGSGNYEMTTASSWPTEGYVFNANLSKCENGGELAWDDTNKKVIMSGNVSDKCYVYFDVYNKPVFCEDSTYSKCDISGGIYMMFSDGYLVFDIYYKSQLESSILNIVEESRPAAGGSILNNYETNIKLEKGVTTYKIKYNCNSYGPSESVTFSLTIVEGAYFSNHKMIASYIVEDKAAAYCETLEDFN